MTISYSLKVSKADVCSFSRLLFMWRGSIYKLIYKELVVFLLLYYELALIYRLALTGTQQHSFESLPLSFILGFYVSLVISRWWSMYEALPWTDSISQLISTHVHGTNEATRIERRTLVRWLNLTAAIVFTSVSMPVLKRFPTIGHLVEAGLMTKEERKEYEALPTPHVKHWMPCGWACNLINKLREENKIKDDVAQNLLLQVSHDWISIPLVYTQWISVPLVYTQVVTIVVYAYFLVQLFAAQFLNYSINYKNFWLDFYFLVLTVIEFFFYFGWLKVAESIINPYGADDDDFELNYIIDRNYQVALLIVDNLHGRIPTLEKDKHWDEPEFELPYTVATLRGRRARTWLGSTVDVLLKAKDFVIAVPNSIISIGNISSKDRGDIESKSKKDTGTELKPLLKKRDQRWRGRPGMQCHCGGGDRF
uniref:Bestrophin homolog n=1 Tax=Saccoglossus kowalevskii TaxID=10224 RepID=A0ABM0M1M9_SACKO|nr:PREDICTED: bestrophin-3-like [Saccoglossus kowalevskii]